MTISFSQMFCTLMIFTIEYPQRRAPRACGGRDIADSFKDRKQNQKENEFKQDLPADHADHD